ncbi:MAG: DUF4838 domain-containing protein [Pirellulales bacterium]|nr:DUF4838 domain-containing protein [Pirellulales bacterium]
MNRKRIAWIGCLATMLAATPVGIADALELVRDGKPVASVVVAAPRETSPSRNRRGGWGDRRAAEVLVEWVGKMTDAELSIVDQAPPSGPVVCIGAAAVEAGLDLDAIDSPSREGLRIRCDRRRLLLAGQSPTATVKAVCRLLEQLGCRYFVDHPIGEVAPRTRDLTVDNLDLTERPGFLMRSIWGSQWSGDTLWKVWNGAGGIRFATGHAWGSYVPKELFEEHPEYFQFRDGGRRPSDWYCTSNSGLREVFARGVVERIRAGTEHPSISPPDGRGYCQCEACRAQDDAGSREPSTGTVCVTNRYCDFYRDVARRVARECPEAILNFYCYADYTQAPTSGVELPANLCAWIAPIRYCRFHRIGHPDCPSRKQLAELLDGWAGAAEKIGYRTYNYNLSECCLPFSKIAVWKHDIPYLREQGCVGINLETLTNWQIYGPHIYLSLRLAYDPAADADAVMDDYFQKFYGPAAGPAMRAYWMGIDRAFDGLRCHAGSFYAMHLVYTPEFLGTCRARLDEATAAARGDETYAARVEMASEGLRNAEQYVALRDAINHGDFQQARQIYGRLLARSQRHQQTGLGNHYTVGYLERFLGGHVAAGAEVTAPPNRLLTVLPDRWRLAHDPEDQGVTKGFHAAALDDSRWTDVATYGSPLDAQGVADRQTILWYRTRFELPKPSEGDRLMLFFTEVDGDAIVYLNGREVGRSQSKRKPFSVDVTAVAVEGKNMVAVRVDHSRITELFLGGILRPVLLVASASDR